MTMYVCLGVGESSGLSAASILAELQASQTTQPLTRQLKELIFLQVHHTITHHALSLADTHT
jgi:hypothetical protein